MSYRIITPPASEPVSVADARSFLQLGSDTSQDTMIALFIQSAREGLERELNRALINQTIEDEFEFSIANMMSMNDASASNIITSVYHPFFNTLYRRFTLHFAPVTSILSVKAIDKDDVATDISDYVKILASEPASVSLTNNFVFSYPLTIRIRYQAGYASSDAVPARIKEAILVNVRHSFDCRMNHTMDSGMTLSDKLVSTYRVFHPEVHAGNLYLL